MVQSVLLDVSPFGANLACIWPQDAVSFLEKLGPEAQLRLLAQALLRETQVDEPLRSLYRLVLSRVLEATSRSQTDGIYKAPSTQKRVIPYSRAVIDVCREVRADLSLTHGLYCRRATLFHGSSEDMRQVDADSCSICVTLPP